MILNSEIENKIKLDSLILKQNITKLKDSLTMLKRQISDNPFLIRPQTAKRPNLQLIKNKTSTKTKKKQSRKVIMKTTTNSRTNLNTNSNSNTNYNTNANSNSKTIEKSKLVSKGIIVKSSITNNQKLNIKNTNTVHRSMTPGYKFKVNQTKTLQQINLNNNMEKNRLPVNKPNQNNMNSNKKKSKPKPKEKPNQHNNELILLRKENKLLKQRLQTESTKNNKLTQMIDNFNSQFR